MTGCETFGDALTTTSAILGGGSSSSSSYSRSPHPTAEQQLKIDNLAFKADNAQIKQAIAEAKPNIQKMLRMTSCFNAKGVQVIAVAGTPYLTNPHFTYHPDNKCVNVERVHGWKMPAKNILKFVVVYSSEISGETDSTNVEMRNEDGEWLVYSHYM